MDDLTNKKNLYNRIWRTKGCRFNAYRRLAKKNSVLTFVTAFSSIHLLAIGILQLTSLIAISTAQSKLLSFISIILSIIILAYSLIENGKEHGLKSERHHLCGIDLDRIYTKLQLTSETDIKEIIKLGSSYNSVTKRYLLNHEEIDDLYFQLQNPDEYPDIPVKWKVNFFYNYYDYTKAAMFVLIPLVISIYVLFYLL
jgi:hypothetical protein